MEGFIYRSLGLQVGSRDFWRTQKPFKWYKRSKPLSEQFAFTHSVAICTDNAKAMTGTSACALASSKAVTLNCAGCHRVPHHHTLAVRNKSLLNYNPWIDGFLNSVVMQCEESRKHFCYRMAKGKALVKLSCKFLNGTSFFNLKEWLVTMVILTGYLAIICSKMNEVSWSLQG